MVYVSQATAVLFGTRINVLICLLPKVPSHYSNIAVYYLSWLLPSEQFSRLKTVHRLHHITFTHTHHCSSLLAEESC